MVQGSGHGGLGPGPDLRCGGGGSLPTPLPVRGGGGGGGGGGAADPATDSETGTDDDDGEGRPSAPPAEGVDYVLHKVLPTDTFQGLCLRYRIRPHVLRRCNGFSGTNLHLAPSTLVVPLGPGGELLGGGPVLRQNRTTPEYKLQALREEFPHLRRPECRAYLEMADWSLEGAREAAAEDDDWEEGQENEGWKKGEREEKGETEPLVTAD